jgi:hypothetical protein
MTNLNLAFNAIVTFDLTLENSPAPQTALGEVRGSFDAGRMSRVALDENDRAMGWIGGISHYKGMLGSFIRWSCARTCKDAASGMHSCATRAARGRTRRLDHLSRHRR